MRRIKKDIWSKPIKIGYAGKNDLVHPPPQKGGRYPTVKHRGDIFFNLEIRVGPCTYTEDAFEEVEDND